MGYVISDEAIVQEMIKNGKLPQCFGALGQQANPETKNTGSQPTNDSIFNKTEQNTQNAPVSPPQAKKSEPAPPQAEKPAQTPEEIRNNELKTLGLQNSRGAGTKMKTPSGKIYTVVGENTNGRKIIEDEEGNLQVISHDNKILDKNYILRSNKADTVRSNPKIAREETVNMLDEQIKNAQKAFDNQQAEDGWAGDFADGISVLWGSDNRASKVSEDLETYRANLAKLREAATKSGDDFKSAFKEMFGTEYDENAIANYIKTPSNENYQKAFGTKNNIAERVAKYNESQQTGAAVVKTTATIGAGVAIGVATGGTGLAAMGVAAGATAASSAAINASDRITSDVGLKEGELTEIAKNAAWDGASVLAGGVVGKVAGSTIRGASNAARAGRAAANTAGDVAMGAAQEYAETGKVSAGGIATNAALGAVGIAAESGAFQKVNNAIKRTPETSGANTINQLYDESGDVVSGGFFSRSSKKPVDLTPDKGWQNFKTDNGEITLLNSDGKIYLGQVGKMNTKEVKLNPGEAKLLGNTSDGSALILECSANGSYSVKNLGGEEKTSLMSRLFNRESKPQQRTVSNPSAESYANISDKQIRQKVQKNLSKNKVGDPGTASISAKLKQALNSDTPLVKELGDNADLSNISKHVDNGEVCAVGTGKNQKLYVNENGTAVELEISKEKFEELFPKNGFALAEQKGRNNCWLVSRLNSMTDSAVGRAKIYSMFKETADGDILVTLPGSNKPIKFPGGKPADVENTRLGEGASSGLEMLHQSVLIKLLKNPSERVDDISKLNVSSLRNEANKLAHTDADATRYLFGKTSAGIYNNTTDYRTKIIDALENFKPGQDMASSACDIHQRSIVNYDKTTRQVTYHDPYYAGIDMTCSLDEFLQNNPSLNVVKADEITNTASPSGSSGVNPKPETSQPSEIHTKRSTNTPVEFRQQTTNITHNEWTEVAQTADGAPIKARILSDRNILIEKNGKRTEIPKPEQGDPLTIHETSTDSFLIVEMDAAGKISITTSQTPELNRTNSTSETAHEKPQPQTSAPALEIPKGFRENGKILGKRSIVDSNNVIMIEKNGVWKKLN